jgi:hypothetical protein
MKIPQQIVCKWLDGFWQVFGYLHSYITRSHRYDRVVIQKQAINNRQPSCIFQKALDYLIGSAD